MALFDVSLKDLLDASVDVEKTKVNARLGATRQMQESFNIPYQYQNAQAKAEALTNTEPTVSDNKTVLIGAALVVVVLVAAVFMAKKKR